MTTIGNRRCSSRQALGLCIYLFNLVYAVHAATATASVCKDFILGSVLGTFLGCILVVCIALVVWNRFKTRKGGERPTRHGVEGAENEHFEADDIQNDHNVKTSPSVNSQNGSAIFATEGGKRTNFHNVTVETSFSSSVDNGSEEEETTDPPFERVYSMVVKKPNKGLGFSIAVAGLYVTAVENQSELIGDIEPGDEIVSINGIPVEGMTEMEAYALIAREGTSLKFEINKGTFSKRVLTTTLKKEVLKNDTNAERRCIKRDNARKSVKRHRSKALKNTSMEIPKVEKVKPEASDATAQSAIGHRFLNTKTDKNQEIYNTVQIEDCNVTLAANKAKTPNDFKGEPHVKTRDKESEISVLTAEVSELEFKDDVDKRGPLSYADNEARLVIEEKEATQGVSSGIEKETPTSAFGDHVTLSNTRPSNAIPETSASMDIDFQVPKGEALYDHAVGEAAASNDKGATSTVYFSDIEQCKAQLKKEGSTSEQVKSLPVEPVRTVGAQRVQSNKGAKKSQHLAASAQPGVVNLKETDLAVHEGIENVQSLARSHSKFPSEGTGISSGKKHSPGDSQPRSRSAGSDSLVSPTSHMNGYSTALQPNQSRTAVLPGYFDGAVVVHDSSAFKNAPHHHVWKSLYSLAPTLSDNRDKQGANGHTDYVMPFTSDSEKRAYRNIDLDLGVSDQGSSRLSNDLPPVSQQVVTRGESMLVASEPRDYTSGRLFARNDTSAVYHDTILNHQSNSNQISAVPEYHFTLKTSSMPPTPRSSAYGYGQFHNEDGTMVDSRAAAIIMHSQSFVNPTVMNTSVIARQSVDLPPRNVFNGPIPHPKADSTGYQSSKPGVIRRPLQPYSTNSRKSKKTLIQDDLDDDFSSSFYTTYNEEKVSIDQEVMRYMTEKYSEPRFPTTMAKMAVTIPTTDPPPYTEVAPPLYLHGLSEPSPRSVAVSVPQIERTSILSQYDFLRRSENESEQIFNDHLVPLSSPVESSYSFSYPRFHDRTSSIKQREAFFKDGGRGNNVLIPKMSLRERSLHLRESDGSSPSDTISHLESSTFASSQLDSESNEPKYHHLLDESVVYPSNSSDFIQTVASSSIPIPFLSPTSNSQFTLTKVSGNGNGLQEAHGRSRKRSRPSKLLSSGSREDLRKYPHRTHSLPASQMERLRRRVQSAGPNDQETISKVLRPKRQSQEDSFDRRKSIDSGTLQKLAVELQSNPALSNDLPMLSKLLSAEVIPGGLQRPKSTDALYSHF